MWTHVKNLYGSTVEWLRSLLPEASIQLLTEEQAQELQASFERGLEARNREREALREERLRLDQERHEDAVTELQRRIELRQLKQALKAAKKSS